MKISLRYLALALTLVLVSALAALAQETTGAIQGTVKDPNGAVVANATVTATSAQRTYTATTNSEGDFKFDQLLPGTYQLQVEASGFAPRKRSDVVVELGKTLQANFDMTLAGSVANVTVTTEEEPLVDITSSKTATNVTQQKIDMLPKSLRFDSVITQAPGARAEFKAGGYEIDGASGSENTFIVDGLDITRVDSGVLGTTKDVPFDFVKEVQIKSAGYEAEFGGATGGVINTVTKSGGNQFHGEVRLDLQSSKWNASDRPARRWNRAGLASGLRIPEYFGNPDHKDKFRGYAPAFDLGGPIIKNKLWFYGSYAPQFENLTRNVYLVDSLGNRLAPTTAQPTVKRPLTLKTKYDYLMGRVDFTPFKKFSFYMTAINSPVKTSGPTPMPGNEITSTSTINNVRLPFQGGYTPANQYSMQGTFLALSNLVLVGRVGRTYLNDKGGSYDIAVGPLITISSPCTATIFGNAVTCPAGSTAGGNPGPITNNSATGKDIIIRKSWSFDGTWTKSIAGQQHSIKAGYQVNNLSQDINTGNQGGTFQFFYGQSAPLAGSPHGTYGYYISNDLGTIGKTSSKNQGFFVQDAWQVRHNVTLNLGIRDEKEFVPSFPLDASGHPGLDLSQLGVDPKAPIKFGWGDKFAPRLGGSWDVWSNGKLKIYGSYSVFYDTMKYNLPLGSFGGDKWIETYHALDTLDYRSINLASQPGATLGVFDLRSPALLLLKNSAGAVYHPVDPNLKPVREHEYTFGGDYSNFHGMFQDNVLGIRFTRKVLDKAIEDIGTMFLTGGVQQEQYQIGNPGFGTAVTDFQALVGTPTPKAVRNYTAFEVRFEKRFTRNYYYNVSWTHSRLFGNYSGLASSDETGRNAPNTNRYFDMPWIAYDAHGKLSNGLLPTDRPNTFKAFWAYRFNYKFFGRKMDSEFSFSHYLYQGTPLSTTVNVEITGTTDGLDNFVPIYPNDRGDLGRTPWLFQTDGLFTQSLHIKEGVALKFRLNVLNLLNNDTVIDRSQAYMRTSSSTVSVSNEYNRPAATAAYSAATFAQAINLFLTNPGDWKAHLTNTALTNPFYNKPITWQAQRSMYMSIGLQF